MNKVKVRFRNENDNGMGWCLLLPLAFLAKFFTLSSETDFILFTLSSCLSVLIFENQTCVQLCEISSPSLIKISYLIASSVFTIIVFSKYNSYSIFFLFILSYLIVWMFQYVLYSLLVKCYNSFTFGEAIIVAQGLSFIACGCFLTWHTKIFGPQDLINDDTSEINKFLQVLLFGGLLLIWTLHKIKYLRTTFAFYGTCVIEAIPMYSCWIYILQQDPFVWIFTVCFQTPARVTLMVFWLVLTSASILFVVIQNTFTRQKASTSARKYFHIMVNFIFVPGIFIDPELLYLACSTIFGIFVVLEIFRLLKIPPFGPSLQNAFQIFLDEKDSGLLILTHIYLLIGCSCPLWLSGGKFKNSGFQISLISGILAVGIGDTMAAVVGSKFGKHKWPNSKKSYEGTSGAIVAQIIVGVPLLLLSQLLTLKNFVILILGIFTSSIVEAKTSQVDNLVLPLVMYPFLRLIS